MALRCVLLGLVVCLGFDLSPLVSTKPGSELGLDRVTTRLAGLVPSSLDIASPSWANSVAQKDTQDVVEPPPGSPAGVPSVTSNGADPDFERVVDRMARSFAAEESGDLVPVVAEVPATESGGNGPTFVDLVGDGAPSNSTITSDDLEGSVGATTLSDEVRREEGTDLHAAARIRSAVHLTHEALRAWATVMHPEGSMTAVRR